MATSHTTPTPHRRPEGDRGQLDGTATPDSTPTPTPTSTHDTASGHTHVRGTLPVAEPIPDPPRPPRRRRATAVRRTAIDAKTPEAIRDVADPAIDAVLDAVVDTAPPLPYEVRARLAWLLRGQHHPPRRDEAA
jgi:hypothetical protein